MGRGGLDGKKSPLLKHTSHDRGIKKKRSGAAEDESRNDDSESRASIASPTLAWASSSVKWRIDDNDMVLPGSVTNEVL